MSLNIEELRLLIKQEEAIEFMDRFGGGFFIQFLGEPAYDAGIGKGAFHLESYSETLELVKQSLEQNKDLLVEKLRKSKSEGEDWRPPK